MRDQDEGILNEIPLRFPCKSKEFRRSPDLSRRGESKVQKILKKSRSNHQIATRGFEERSGDDGEKMNKLGFTPPSVLYIGHCQGQMIRGKAGSSGHDQRGLGAETR